MQIGHKIDDRFRYCMSDFIPSLKQQACVENVNCAGMAVCDCRTIARIDCFSRTCGEIVAEKRRV